MPILTKLREYLDKQKVPYEVLSHRQAFTAQEVAQAQHLSGRELAKVVMVRSGGAFVMLVVPAPYRVDLERAKSAVGKTDLVLATEDEFRGLFPHCEAGAMPPFGNLYDLPVYVDQTLTRDEEIVCNAGTHTQTVKMKYADFARLVQPKVVAVDREVRRGEARQAPGIRARGSPRPPSISTRSLTPALQQRRLFVDRGAPRS